MLINIEHEKGNKKADIFLIVLKKHLQQCSYFSVEINFSISILPGICQAQAWLSQLWGRPQEPFLRIIKSVTSNMSMMILIVMVMVIMMLMIKIKMISPVYQRERKAPSGLMFSI